MLLGIKQFHSVARDEPVIHNVARDEPVIQCSYGLHCEENIKATLRAFCAEYYSRLNS